MSLKAKTKKAGEYWLHGSKKITFKAGETFTGADAEDLIRAGLAEDPREEEADRQLQAALAAAKAEKDAPKKDAPKKDAGKKKG